MCVHRLTSRTTAPQTWFLDTRHYTWKSREEYKRVIGMVGCSAIKSGGISSCIWNYDSKYICWKADNWSRYYSLKYLNAPWKIILLISILNNKTMQNKIILKFALLEKNTLMNLLIFFIELYIVWSFIEPKDCFDDKIFIAFFFICLISSLTDCM